MIKQNILDCSSHTFIIAEAGSNWKCGSVTQDLKRAKELIQVAAEAGADAVKFQTYKPETVYVQSAGTSKYLAKNGIKKDIYKIFEHHSMPYEMIPELAKYCKEEKIMFMSTPFSISDARAIDPYVQIHKVASYEINHIRLLEFLARTKKPIIISTGASTYSEIDFAVKTIRNANKKVALMQCTAKYPAPIDSLNILAIQEMKNRYDLPVGLSDHSMDPMIAPLLAVGIGATIIEKHFTLDRKLPGPDHKFALIPSELKSMINAIRSADKAKGLGKKTVLNEEKELRQFATRSLQAIKDIKKGEIFKEGYNFDVLRPGNQKRGADARFLVQINGKKSNKNIKIGHGVLLSDRIT